MDVTDGIRRQPRSTVVSIGNFDGVHIGHRRVVEELRREAASRGLESVVLTFDRHAASVVRPERAPRLLTGAAHKLELLVATGVDEVVILTFDARRAAEPAEDFVRTVLVGQLGAAEVLVGENFRFGHRQQGDVALLEEMGVELGFRARAMPLVVDDERHEVVSSTRIRHLVAAADLDAAARLLARPHEVRGRLERDGRSVRLAFVPELLTPPSGLYAGTLGPPGDAGVPVLARVEAPEARHAPARIEVVPDGDGSAPGDLVGAGEVALRFASVVEGAVPGRQLSGSAEQPR